MSRKSGVCYNVHLVKAIQMNHLLIHYAKTYSHSSSHSLVLVVVVLLFTLVGGNIEIMLLLKKA